MHHCLEIHEIVRNICDHMDKKTSLSLGLTCRATLEPALERIWEVIDSWEFLRSLPEASWKITLEPCNAYECSSDQPCTRYFEPSDNDGFKPADLTRYLKHYAPKIRVLTLGEAMGRAVDKELGILSPFLKQFTWLSPDALGYYTSNSEVMDIIPSRLMYGFLGPSVHIVRMEVNSSCDDLYIPFVDCMAVRLGPTLSKLDLGTYDPDLCDLGALEDILDLAPKWNRLESLNLPTIFSVENIIALASLPCLRYLRLQLVEDVSDFGGRSKVEEAYLALNPFSALEELDIRGPNFRDIVGFLDYLPKDTIIHTFIADSNEFNSTEDAQEMVETVRKHFDPLHLKYLSICDGQGRSPGEPEEPLDPDELGWDDSADITCLIRNNDAVPSNAGLGRGLIEGVM
ncbi:hypothetical protein DFP72DRAFT_1046704 [Ephemerocybe angulata]|uniref:Uncharacterized protein n=1 Tax=Ephemerocybe angulata TaxID=980116 RepID=A0A8H6M6K5_9AGAR|nr:hypothetical protein DFP72DRAFT_1046704 [Tulosesus angulatus]